MHNHEMLKKMTRQFSTCIRLQGARKPFEAQRGPTLTHTTSTDAASVLVLDEFEPQQVSATRRALLYTVGERPVRENKRGGKEDETREKRKFLCRPASRLMGERRHGASERRGLCPAPPVHAKIHPNLGPQEPTHLASIRLSFIHNFFCTMSHTLGVQ